MENIRDNIKENIKENSKENKAKSSEGRFYLVQTNYLTVWHQHNRGRMPLKRAFF